MAAGPRLACARRPAYGGSREGTREELAANLLSSEFQRFCRRCDAESRGHCHQVSERVGSHLSHHVAPVCLHRDLADAELATHRLVEQTGDHQAHDFSLATAIFAPSGMNTDRPCVGDDRLIRRSTRMRSRAVGLTIRSDAWRIATAMKISTLAGKPANP